MNIILVSVLTEKMIFLFEEIEKLPTTLPFQTHSPYSPLLSLRFGPCSSSILKSLPHTPKPTPEEYQLVQKRDDALRRNIYLQERLDETREKQERMFKRLAEVQLQQNEAKRWVDYTHL